MTYYNIEIKLIMLKNINSHMLKCLSTSLNAVLSFVKICQICQNMSRAYFNYAPREILINASPGSSSAQLVPA